MNRREVAKASGVSPATVSNVFERPEVVKEETRKKVLEMARKLKYVPNHAARSLSSGNTKNIGVAVYEYTNPYHMEIIRGMESYAIRNGYSVTVFLLDDAIEDKLSFIEGRQLSALVNFVTNGYPSSFVDILRNNNTLLVNFGEDLGLSPVNNLENAYFEYMAELAELGHKNVGFITGIDKVRWKMDARGKAFERRGEFGLSTDEDLISYATDFSECSEKLGYDGAKELLTRRNDITALFAINDLAAIGAMRAIYEMGYHVPQDISVIGCDDISISKYLSPGLSTITFDKYTFGVEIMKKIVKSVETHSSAVGEKVEEFSVPMRRESIAAARNI